MTAHRERLAVYGGSFDPPHVAHVMCAAYVLATARVARLLVIPTYRHPFAKPLAPYPHRVRMCELAMTDVRRVEISRVEEDLGGDSLTLHTLQELSRRHPDHGLALVIGSDLVEETARWHRFHEVRALAELIVIGRTGHPSADALPVALPPVSSTEIRRRFRTGESVDGLVPHTVAAYVAEHGLYAG